MSQGAAPHRYDTKPYYTIPYPTWHLYCGTSFWLHHLTAVHLDCATEEKLTESLCIHEMQSAVYVMSVMDCFVSCSCVYCRHENCSMNLHTRLWPCVIQTTAKGEPSLKTFCWEEHPILQSLKTAPAVSVFVLFVVCHVFFIFTSPGRQLTRF